jgi:hypothetical protein
VGWSLHYRDGAKLHSRNITWKRSNLLNVNQRRLRTS